mgnify:CR=1 FL=1
MGSNIVGDKMKKLKALIIILGFILSISLIYKGLRITSYFGLAIMLIGLAGLLFELYLYNRKYQ